MRTFIRPALSVLIPLLILAQEPVPNPGPNPNPATPGTAALADAISRSPFGLSSQEPQAYAKVITKEAKSKSGLFTVHEVKEKFFYEIPKAELNKEFLFVTQVARTTLGVGYGGQFVGERVVRWERRGNKINLREVNYEVVADPKQAISLAVKAANNDTIIMSFPIAAFGREPGKDRAAASKTALDEEKTEDAEATPVKPIADVKSPLESTAKTTVPKPAATKPPARIAPVREYKETGREPTVVIDVTRLFTSDVFELSARQRLNATMMDPTRSYVERISPFPENIEVEATHTYTRLPMPSGLLTTQSTPFSPGGMRPGSATVVLHHSMVKLPEKPMMPRVFDERVGYFAVRQMDYGRDEQRAPRRTYITRWRLEKKDPNAQMSEPVKPIVYYIDAATPPKWIPYMKRGVESWQAAFESAGFKNAIVAKQAPTPEQDPNFSPEDVRYSVIRWLPSTIENAMGPHIADPRTGEILNADIQFYHNIMNLQRDWYFLQVGPLDARADKLPLPDDLMGRLLEFVCAHEVGHTLGFQHNMKASSLYPQDRIRDKDWVKKMGHTPSIMDYSRFNYVAQPEDGIDVADLVPSIGPYDKWATRWGYTPIAAAQTSDDEKKTLDTWAREQDKTPWFRFSTAGAGGSDPGELTEAVGDADAVKSTALGVKNLQRVSRMLLTATSTKEGDPYDDLSELYGRMLGQWTLEMNHVVALVGGFQSQQKAIGQQGVIYSPVPKDRQVSAVAFLDQNAFATPKWMIEKDILRRIEPIGAISRVGNAQRSILNNLFSSARFARLVEQETLDGSSSYAPPEFLATVRRSVWQELESPRVTIDSYRRQLQRNYLDLVNAKLNGPELTVPFFLPQGFPFAFFASSGDEKPAYRAELLALKRAVDGATAKSSDASTRAHLEGARDQIAKILDPRFASTRIGAGPTLQIFGDQWSGQPSYGVDRAAADDSKFSPSVDAPWEQLTNCWPDYIIRP